MMLADMDSARRLHSPTPSSNSARTYLRCLKESQSKPCTSADFRSEAWWDCGSVSMPPRRLQDWCLRTPVRGLAHERGGWDARIAAVQSHGPSPPIAQLALGRWFTSDYRQGHPDEMAQICGMIERTSPDGYIGCCGVLRDTDLQSQLAAIEIPCLVITGSGDPATPPADGRALHARLRNSTCLELHASHLSAWERSTEFAGAILDFFQGKEGSNG